MAQKYKTCPTFKHKNSKGKTREYPRTRKGVAIIHLFNEEWRIGRLVEKIGKEPHVVIYAPDDKLYHVYGYYALKIGGDNGRSNIDKLEAKVWILTSILDDPEFWSRNMKETPEIGMPVKVIYETGTIKWIDNFKGNWKDHRMEIPIKYPTRLNPEWESWGITRKKKDGETQPSQYLWEDDIEYKNIIAWRMKK